MKLGNVGGGQYAYSVIAEILALYVIRGSVKFNEKSAKNADLYEVSLENLRRGIRESSGFGADIKALSDSFEPTSMSYIPNFFDDGSEKKLRKFLENKSFPNTSNIHIGGDSINFISYLMSHILAKLTRTVCLLNQYAGKSTITIDGFRYAVNIHFPGEHNELNELFIQRLDEIEKLVADYKELEKDAKSESGDKDDKDDEDKDESEDEEEKEEEEEEEDNKKKGKKGAAKKKAGKKKEDKKGSKSKKDKDEDDDDDEDDKSENEEDEED
jgi:hypothetical protein